MRQETRQETFKYFKQEIMVTGLDGIKFTYRMEVVAEGKWRQRAE